ncbi:MAG: class I SAM-dependent methyltransferase [Anaerolineales bacterium]
MSDLPKLYAELAEWWPVFDPPEEYAEGAEFYREAIVAECATPPRNVLELGCGGGNNASHMKRHFPMTLTDLSPEMLEVSRLLNPECEHIQGDMRELRLGRQFDAVFVHDAISYLTSEEDLRRAIHTAFIHCKPGGAALFAPYHVKDTFREATDHGGHDRRDRSLRFMEWRWDPDPDDTNCVSEFVYLMRKGDGPVQFAYDHHVFGLFSRQVWLGLIDEAGFRPRVVSFKHGETEPHSHDVFLGARSED